MHIQSNVTLDSYSTMRLGGIARALVEISTKNELLDAIAWAEMHKQPLLILGGGSNIIFQDGFAGLVIVNHLAGFEVINDTSDETTLRIGAGEDWDSVVERSVARGLSGIEKLSSIPGTAGATPVQNVGAYGAEIADTLIELEAYDLTAKQFVTLCNANCHFAYRESIFKPTTDRHYIITSITLRLSKAQPKQPFYESLQQYLDEHDIHNYSARTIREAIIAIRKIKLPDPRIVANTGSFFKNPIISQDICRQLQNDYPSIPHWPTPDGFIKISAGWLIDQAGLKGYESHGMKIYPNNALVFVNEHAKSYNDLAAFRQEVLEKVFEKFAISLEQEPELI